MIEKETNAQIMGVGMEHILAGKLYHSHGLVPTLNTHGDYP